MTFNYIAAKKVFDCKFFIEDKFPNAIDIGVQTPTIRKNTIEKFINIENLTSKQDYFYKQFILEKTGVQLFCGIALIHQINK